MKKEEEYNRPTTTVSPTRGIGVAFKWGTETVAAWIEHI